MPANAFDRPLRPAGENYKTADIGIHFFFTAKKIIQSGARKNLVHHGLDTPPQRADGTIDGMGASVLIACVAVAKLHFEQTSAQDGQRLTDSDFLRRMRQPDTHRPGRVH